MDPGSVIADASTRRKLGGSRGFGSPGLVIGLIIVGSVTITALVAPLIAPFSPTQTNADAVLVPPGTGSHLLGTDDTGMDVLSRILYAPRVDLTIAVAATGIAVIVGSTAGLVAGFYKNAFSEVIMRTADLLQSFPVYVLGMALVVMTGHNIGNVVIALAVISAPVYTRLVRSEVVELRERLFINALRAHGVSERRIVMRHILPNASGPIFAMASVTVGTAMLVTAGLSFIGAGVRPPTPEWGSMISIGTSDIISGGQWWPSVVPGAALAVTVFGFGLVGDSLSVIADPRRRRLGRSRRRRGAAEMVVRSGRPLTHERDKGLTPRNRTSVRVLDISDLSVGFGGSNLVIDGVSFAVDQGELLGVVGETASGKSTLVWSTVGLPPPGAQILHGCVKVMGRDLLKLKANEAQGVRARTVGLVVQNARAHLNPLLPVGKQLMNAYRAAEGSSRREARQIALKMLEAVAMPEPAYRFRNYASELSGGMAQRVMIAMALIHAPRLIVMDEPTMGLDVTIQTQILDLLREQSQSLGAAGLLVTRDLGIVAHYCDRVAVMQKGRLVEMGSVDAVFDDPRHPYTRRLLQAAAFDERDDPSVVGQR